MKINIKMLFPSDLSIYVGYQFVRIATVIFLLLTVARSSIHLFSSDGGANQIAGIDISVAGGDNIVAIFHQWGATQLLLACFLTFLFFRYPGMTPLTLLILAMDPVMRFVAGRMKSVTTDGPPPGETLNGPIFVLLLVLFLTALIEKKLYEPRS
jgi:hypothetical protein